MFTSTFDRLTAFSPAINTFSRNYGQGRWTFNSYTGLATGYWAKESSFNDQKYQKSPLMPTDELRSGFVHVVRGK